MAWDRNASKLSSSSGQQITCSGVGADSGVIADGGVGADDGAGHPCGVGQTAIKLG